MTDGTQELDEILRDYDDDNACSCYSDCAHPKDTKQAKQAIKQLVADEMRELIGEDLRPLPNGYMPESHEQVNNRLAIQRTKLAEWLKESV